MSGGRYTIETSLVGGRMIQYNPLAVPFTDHIEAPNAFCRAPDARLFSPGEVLAVEVHLPRSALTTLCNR